MSWPRACTRCSGRPTFCSGAASTISAWCRWVSWPPLCTSFWWPRTQSRSWCLVSPSASLERIYRQFAAYPRPETLWVCEQCGPEWSADDIRETPLRSVSLPQLVAVHVMSLGDDGLRHFIPRLMDVMVGTPAPVFDFRLADLKHRLPAWEPAEQGAVGGLAEAIWSA